MQAMSFPALGGTNLDTVLSPDICAVWDAMSIGVAIVDSEGFCRYMNPIQRRIDGFKQVEGKHITSLYIPHDLKIIPTLECLQKGQHLLNKVYTYKTTQNIARETASDFFALFRNGVRDGVLAFTVWLDPTVSSKASSNGDSEKKLSTVYTFADLIGEHSTLQALLNHAKTAANAESPILIWGESGTGKEVIAQAIHAASNRCDQAFIPINCAAIPETLLESILFGTTGGAYTGASNRAGLFERANHGTLLLDELNSMPLNLQSKLLRVLQEKRVRRVGSHCEIPIDVRIISIMNQSPLVAVQRGILRQDFFFRLAVVSLGMPPLRERRDDIPILIQNIFARKKREKVVVSPEVMQMFMEYHWPGNVRELEHVIEGSLSLLHGRKRIELDMLPRHFVDFYKQEKGSGVGHRHEEILPQSIQTPALNFKTYFDFQDVARGSVNSLKNCMQTYERACICNVLRVTGGNVAKAARMMEMTPAGLRYRVKCLGIGSDEY